jgi:hypothetical protein
LGVLTRLLIRRGAVLPPDLNLPTDLWEAVVAWFRADPGMASTFPGGILAGKAAQSQAYPYLRYEVEEDEDRPAMEDRVFTVAFGSVGVGADQAKTGGDYLAARLDAPASRSALLFADADGRWAETFQRTVRTAKAYEVGQGPGDEPVWRYDLTFRVGFILDLDH